MSLGIAVERQAKRRPQSLAVFDGPRSLTWAELDARTNRLANAFTGRYGIAPGDRVALFAPNRLEVVEVLVAAHKARATYVGLNFRMDALDLDAVFQNAEPRLLIADAEYAPIAGDIAERFGVPLLVIGAADGDGYEDALGAALASAPPSTHHGKHTDQACIVYTSGTTGRPKGVLFDHAAMLQHATVACIEYEIDPQTRYLIQIPHNSSVNITIAPCLLAGAAVGFADNRGFSPPVFAEAVAAHAVTHTFLVPTQLMRVLDQLPAKEQRFASLGTLGYGSSPISPDRLGDLVDRFGPIFLQLYGMAEIASIGTLLRKHDHVRALSGDSRLLASAGQPSLAMDVRVVDDDGNDVGIGDRGEVVFAGPHLMNGYYREPERTAEVVVDGWMHSGDIAEVDQEGFLYIVDRKKHLIIRGGQNIAPTEVENVLYNHPAVLEVAVVGAPDPSWGERVVAVVALREGATASERELLAFAAAADLARIKRPEEVRFTDSLPKNAVGKIDKAAVRSMFWGPGRAV